MFRAGRRGSFMLAGATLAALGVMGWKIADAAGFRDRLTGRSPQTQTETGSESRLLRRRPPPRPPRVSRSPRKPGSTRPARDGIRRNRPIRSRNWSTAPIEHNRRRYLNVTPGAQQNSPWQIMHGILAYREDLQLKLSQPGDSSKINAIEYISNEAVYPERILVRGDAVRRPRPPVQRPLLVRRARQPVPGDPDDVQPPPEP